MALMAFSSMACSLPAHASEPLPAPKADLPKGQPGETRTAVLAGGCFWCTEAVFKQLDGVTRVASGYAGGTAGDANYEAVSGGRTNHAEAIEITYEASKTTYGQLLRVFFDTHDPTTKDQQGPDHGRQYRSAIFFASEDQKRVAEAYLRQLEEAKAFKKPIVTTLEPLTKFYPAEGYHQDYVERNPDNGYVRQVALPKVKKVREKFPDQLKGAAATQPATRPATQPASNPSR